MFLVYKFAASNMCLQDDLESAALAAQDGQDNLHRKSRQTKGDQWICEVHAAGLCAHSKVPCREEVQQP